VGDIVEITDVPATTGEDFNGIKLPECNGKLGQLYDYHAGTQKLVVTMLDAGIQITVSPEYVKAASVPKPGDDPDAEDGFDVVLGPRTTRLALGEEMSNCLLEKGFVVLKGITDPKQNESALTMLKSLESDGKFGRLGQELEEGYLGKGGTAKTMWVNSEENVDISLSLVDQIDDQLTQLAEIIQPYCEDALGCVVEDRTPALVCLPLFQDDYGEYESPLATEEQISDYYGVWCRSVLRMIHFGGPGRGTLTLTPKTGSVLSGASECVVNAGPNTTLLIREDTFEYSYEQPQDGEEAFWMQCFLLKPGIEFQFGELEGNPDVLRSVQNGPPPPTQDLAAVVAFSIQSAANMSDHGKEWAAYLAGTDGQLEFPLMRFDYRPYYSDEVDMPNGTTFTKHMSAQEGVEMFDNKAFEVSNVESESMCPQCRQCLEVGCLSLAQLGITKKWCNTHPTHASVSVGCDKEEWLNMPEAPRSVATNNQLAITANRFSYIFNLKGGSYVCDTACSSSLVATHLGKVNLLERRWDPLEYHLAMGTNLSLTVGLWIGGCAAHMMSPGGRCFTFNATANGYNRGDGTAAVLIKAGTNDDERVCYLRGTQMGQDGRSASLSAPNGPAQEKCIWGAVREARMTPPESTVWECHGTGTSLGDPIEVGAVRKVQVKMPRKEPLMIGTSKSNIGHLEGSAAAVAMCKCILTVIHTRCAPTVHLKTLNPHLDHAAFDAIFCTETNPYKYRQGHCQVSSFGVGGTNGHAIFWGQDSAGNSIDFTKVFMRKLRANPPPVIADGPNPENWEFQGIPKAYDPADAGSKWKVVFERDPISEEEVFRFEKEEEEEMILPEYYSVSANVNEWTEDRMMEGDVPGVFTFDAEIPESGFLDFRILVEGDAKKALGPETNACTRKTAPMVGPGEDIETFWRIEAEPESPVRIEFLAPAKGAKAISWVKVR